MKTLKLKKSFKDVLMYSVFVAESNGKLNNTEPPMREAFTDAKEKVCIVLENGMTDVIARMLSEVRARKYVIVPKIEEVSYQKLKNEIIAREVDGIKGNYAIVDGKTLFFFDGKFNGYIVEDDKAVEIIQQIFLKEFWENGQEEFIDRKRPCAEVTFDVPPIYGNGSVLLDETFDEATDVEKLINGAKVLAYMKKADLDRGKVIIKNAQLNSEFLKKTANENILLAKDLPCSLAFNGTDTYILNFDIEKYRTLPERGEGRLFAVKCEELSVGKTYKFFKHKTVAELVNADVLSCDGNALTVLENAEEQRKITADLRMAAEYEKMDAETLESRLEKKYPQIFNTEKYAADVTYNIAVEIAKRTMTGVAEVYGEYEKAKETLRKEWNEVLSLAKQQKFEKKIEKYEVKIEGISTRTAYLNAVSSINEAIKLLNNHGDADIDEALSEVTGKKKKLNIQPVSAVNLKMDIPVNGKLYQHKGNYEYVLTSENRLFDAMAEMQSAGIENANIQYLTE